MCETKFTPGPWFVFTPSDYEGPGEMPGLGIENKDGASVVWYATAPEEGIENDSDASLIAAAPDLYAAVENLIAAITPLHNAHFQIERECISDKDVEDAQAAVRTAEIALAKARGENQ